MAMTPLPDPPSRQDPVTFSDKSDALLGALPAFVTEANALQVDVLAKQVIASDAATAADGSADAAAASAVTAGEHKDAALAHKNAAAASAGAAAASLEALNNTWLGAFSADPATGFAGAPLVAGNVYINTTTGQLKAYNGTAWVLGISAISGVSSVNGLTGDVVITAPPPPFDSGVI